MKKIDIINIIYFFILPLILISISKWLGLIWLISSPIMILYLTDMKDKEKQNKGPGLDTYIQDEIKSGNVNISEDNSEQEKPYNKLQETLDEIEDMEEYVTEKRAIIMKSLYEGIEEKDYQGNIEYDLENGEELQEILFPYVDDYQKYNIIIGASYQETGDIDSARRYFDNYIQTLDVSNLVAEDMNDEEKKILLLMNELNKLGFSYKIKKSNIH